MRKIMAMAVAVLVLVGCQPASTVTITATTPSTAICGQQFIVKGQVTPADATPVVTLQIRRDGKWSDWMWYDQYYEVDPGIGGWYIDDEVDRFGAYSMDPRTPVKPGTTYAFRVRSAGRSVVSPTFYVKVVAPANGKCPRDLWDPTYAW